MNREAFESLDREGLLGVALAQAEAIERQAEAIATLRAEIAGLRARLDRPPKTPDNSSIPPSQGHKKATEFVKNRRKKKAHPGAHRPLHPNPTQPFVQSDWLLPLGFAVPVDRHAEVNLLPLFTGPPPSTQTAEWLIRARRRHKR